MSGPCAKLQVRCAIITRRGDRYEGSNDCENPQPVCPRAPGEGYEKCKTICRQNAHAEVEALAKVPTADRLGAMAFVLGHTYACRACQETLYSAGIFSISCEAAP